jgi:hypothetical protein
VRLVLLLLFVCACDWSIVPPLRDKIAVGRDPYLVFVGGSARSSDLYAVSADGGEV